MYAFFVELHNILRWAVVLLGFLAAGRAFWGWYGKKEWAESDRKIGLAFTSMVDLQLLVGGLLYLVFSEWALKAVLNKGMAFVMKQGEYRFFSVEHLVYMVLGIVFAHLGSTLPKKVEDSRSKFKRATIWFGLAIILIMAGIPWSRPLFPGL
jgi:hypothetical protein